MVNEKVMESEQRIPVVTQPSEEQRELLNKSRVGGEILNVFATMAHNPRLAKRFNVLGGYFVADGHLPERDREIAILRTAYRTDCEYEFGRHSYGVQRKELLTSDEVRVIATNGVPDSFSLSEIELVRFVDEICADNSAGDSAFGALASRYDEAELVEVTLLVGFYRMLAGFLNTMLVNREEGIPGFPK